MTALYLYCLAFGVLVLWYMTIGDMFGPASNKLQSWGDGRNLLRQTFWLGTAFNAIWWSLRHLGAM
jgi:hypothetical protein